MKFNPYGSKTLVDKKTGEEFNPSDFGFVGMNKEMKRGGGRLFTDSGELNAYSNQEALQKIAGIVDFMHSGAYQVEEQGVFEKTAEDEALIRQAFADPSGESFARVGQALLNPIKEVIDYEGLARKCLVPRTVKAGEVVRYDKDVFVTSWQIGEDAETAESVVEGSYFYPSEFEITAYPSIEFKDKHRAQYDILARVQDRARQSIEHSEDVAMVNLLQAAGNAVNNTVFFATLNLAAFESLRYEIEQHRLVADKLVIHRQELSDIVNTLSTQVDPVTQRELIMAGYIGSLLNMKIVTTAGTQSFEILEPGEVIALVDGEYLGGMPIRAELSSEPVNQTVNGKPRQGWFWYELLSMFIGNPAGIALGSKL